MDSLILKNDGEHFFRELVCPIDPILDDVDEPLEGWTSRDYTDMFLGKFISFVPFSAFGFFCRFFFVSVGSARGLPCVICCFLPVVGIRKKDGGGVVFVVG